ncbi:hypothetical protein [Palleronia rufa]|uniref:hypothetical protein n=2 Tax=Palleronia rufa TaxID=1530186 RepID=UPI0039EF86FF
MAVGLPQSGVIACPQFDTRRRLMGLLFGGPSPILTSIAQPVQKATPTVTEPDKPAMTVDTRSANEPEPAAAPSGVAEGESKESAVAATVVAAGTDPAATVASTAVGTPAGSAVEPLATTAGAADRSRAAPAADAGGAGAASFADRAESVEDSDAAARAAAESARASFSRDRLISTVATAGQGGAMAEKAALLAVADAGYSEGKATSEPKAEPSLARAV